MTRTEFLLLADAMRASRPPSIPRNSNGADSIIQHAHGAQWERDCYSIAAHIKRVNPAFDAVLFLANCKDPA